MSCSPSTTTTTTSSADSSRTIGFASIAVGRVLKRVDARNVCADDGPPGRLPFQARLRRDPRAGARRGQPDAAEQPRFVVHEHHARRLHWDLRLERDGVLVSWAVPKGIPPDPKRNHLAVHTEDHPIEYIDFAGEIPAGNYGAGVMKIWDSGTYETHKFREDEVMVTFHGEHLHGRYVLFRTRGDDWMIHRMDPPEDPEREPMPEHLAPMLATTGGAPARRGGLGVRDQVGRRARDRATRRAGRCGWRAATGATSRPATRSCASSAGRSARARRSSTARSWPSTTAGRVPEAPGPHAPDLRARGAPAGGVGSRSTYMIFDLLYLDGHSLMDAALRGAARARCSSSGSPARRGRRPPTMSATASACSRPPRAQGLEGIIAKRLDCPYTPGRRSSGWVKVKNIRRTDAVIGGWLPGEGGRSGRLGALVIGFYEDGELQLRGARGDGLHPGRAGAPRRAARAARARRQPVLRAPAAEAHALRRAPSSCAWSTTPRSRTRGTLRQPSYKGLRDDIDPEQVGPPGD